MKPSVSLLFAFSTLMACATPTEQMVWSVSQNTDPITGVRHCIVAAYDRAAGAMFTRVGYLYPFVENNSKLGWLVGVSSGGRVRLPVGNILWRIDDKPFRQLRAVDNPDLQTYISAIPNVTSSNDASSAAVQDAIASTQRLAASFASTSTVGSGERAREMLNEMLAGRSLIFRADTAGASYGLPTNDIGLVGQFTADGLMPIPIDTSFRQSLTACGWNQ